MEDLPFWKIERRVNFQPRLHGLNQDTVQDYTEALQNGAAFPPVTVFKLPDGEYVLVDGWHRMAAYSSFRDKCYTVKANVIEGSEQDAHDFAFFEANRQNGQRLSKKDVRRIAEVYVNDPRFVNLNHREYAKAIGVSESLAYSVQKSHKSTSHTTTAILTPRDFSTAERNRKRAQSTKRIFAQMFNLLEDPDGAGFVNPQQALRLIELLKPLIGES